jgi:hypothetical protein
MPLAGRIQSAPAEHLHPMETDVIRVTRSSVRRSSAGLSGWHRVLRWAPSAHSASRPSGNPSVPGPLRQTRVEHRRSPIATRRCDESRETSRSGRWRPQPRVSQVRMRASRRPSGIFDATKVRRREPPDSSLDRVRSRCSERLRTRLRRLQHIHIGIPIRGLQQGLSCCSSVYGWLVPSGESAVWRRNSLGDTPTCWMKKRVKLL